MLDEKRELYLCAMPRPFPVRDLSSLLDFSMARCISSSSCPVFFILTKLMFSWKLDHWKYQKKNNPLSESNWINLVDYEAGQEEAEQPNWLKKARSNLAS